MSTRSVMQFAGSPVRPTTPRILLAVLAVSVIALAVLARATFAQPMYIDRSLLEQGRPYPGYGLPTPYGFVPQGQASGTVPYPHRMYPYAGRQQWSVNRPANASYGTSGSRSYVYGPRRLHVAQRPGSQAAISTPSYPQLIAPQNQPGLQYTRPPADSQEIWISSETGQAATPDRHTTTRPSGSPSSRSIQPRTTPRITPSLQAPVRKQDSAANSPPLEKPKPSLKQWFEDFQGKLRSVKLPKIHFPFRSNDKTRSETNTPSGETWSKQLELPKFKWPFAKSQTDQKKAMLGSASEQNALTDKASSERNGFFGFFDKLKLPQRSSAENTTRLPPISTDKLPLPKLKLPGLPKSDDRSAMLSPQLVPEDVRIGYQSQQSKMADDWDARPNTPIKLARTSADSASQEGSADDQPAGNATSSVGRTSAIPTVKQTVVENTDSRRPTPQKTLAQHSQQEAEQATADNRQKLFHTVIGTTSDNPFRPSPQGPRLPLVDWLPRAEDDGQPKPANPARIASAETQESSTRR